MGWEPGGRGGEASGRAAPGLAPVAPGLALGLALGPAPALAPAAVGSRSGAGGEIAYSSGTLMGHRPFPLQTVEDDRRARQLATGDGAGGTTTHPGRSHGTTDAPPRGAALWHAVPREGGPPPCKRVSPAESWHAMTPR